jgi:hypothetical protein
MILCQSAFCLNTNENYDSKNISYMFLSVMSAGVAFKQTHIKLGFVEMVTKPCNMSQQG